MSTATGRTTKRLRPRRARSVAVFTLAFLLFAGAGAAARPRATYQQLLAEELRHRGLDPAKVFLPYQLTEEMRRWAHEIAPPKLSHRQKLERLVEGLLDAESLDLEYTWGHTGTAVEVFEDRQANCLAFTNLFLGMAREVGVPVHFLAVKDVASYRKDEDLVIVSDHIAVGYRQHRELLVFDFSAQPRDKLLENLRGVSDLTAIAMFHSNRGAEALQRDRIEESIGWLETAVKLDPELVNGWINLGVTRRRAGDTAGAEKAYQRALEVDPRVNSTYHNLASLLYFVGRAEEAEQYEQTLRRSPGRNPYTFLSLGDISFRNGRFGEARRFYRRAVSLSPDDADSYAALGEVAAAAGDLRTARKMLRKARKHDLDNRRTLRLAQRIESHRS